jgi:hypothetical protein
LLRRDSLHGPGRSHRHEDRRFDLTVGGGQHALPGSSVRILMENLKANHVRIYFDSCSQSSVAAHAITVLYSCVLTEISVKSNLFYPRKDLRDMLLYGLPDHLLINTEILMD